MRRTTALLLCFCLLLTAFAALTVRVSYAETPKEKLERIKKEIEATRSEIARLEGDREKAEELRQQYLSLANALKAQLAALREDIAAQCARIEAKNAEVAEKAACVLAEKEKFEQRMKGMYEMSRQSNLALLLGAGDLARMQRLAENLQQIAQRDTGLVEHLREEEAALEAESAELNAFLAQLAAREQEETDTLAAYADAIQQADASISAAEAALLAQNEAESDLEGRLVQAQKEWEDWARAQDVPLTFGGVFIWPLPANFTRISSGFQDERDVWNNGQTDIHRGIDIPAPLGTPIYAAADGIVSTNNHSSYGISVKLSHGNGVATIYGHMSSRVVNEGDVVTQGQLIGYVGLTGNTNGYHLHFEVNVNGQVANPWNYLKA